uniref:Uncharacterized protein n=1 Tax=Caenorhabditis japonica TaxID=281687 RepID=A0A8R1IT68_CAEJA
MLLLLLLLPSQTVASAGKKNKKNKNRKNSEKEAKEPTPAPEVVEEVFEKKIVSPNTTENAPAPAAAPVAAPAQKENKNKKKNKKGSGNSESHDVAPTVEIPQTTDAGKQSPGSDKENSSVPNGSAKKQLSVEELDYGVTAQNNEAAAGGDKKNKKKNKKGKNSNSISENTQVIAQLDQDHLDQLADDEVQAITGAAGTHSPPIQVHEVTSSEQHANGNGTTIEKQTTIEITQALDDTNISPTQFQKNVQKLVQAQLAKHDIVEIDPTVVS